MVQVPYRTRYQIENIRTVPALCLTGAAAAAGLAFINSLGYLAGYVGPQVVAWLTQGSGDYGPALFALGLSMLTPAAVVLVLRARGPLRVPKQDLPASAHQAARRARPAPGRSRLG